MLNALTTKGMHLQTSDDGQLRLFSWDTAGGGTMHEMVGRAPWREATGRVHAGMEQAAG